MPKARYTQVLTTSCIAYYDYPISTGPLEGTNTKIRALQRQAYGFRNTEFFKLEIILNPAVGRGCRVQLL